MCLCLSLRLTASLCAFSLCLCLSVCLSISLSSLQAPEVLKDKSTTAVYVQRVGQGTVKDRVKRNKGSIELTPFLQKALKQKGKPGYVSRYMRVWRTSFMGRPGFVSRYMCVWRTSFMGRPGFISRYMCVWRTSFMGALLFSGQLRLTFPMIHKKWKSFNYCERKQ